MKLRESASYRTFYLCNIILLTAISILCILPLIHLFAVSLSDKGAANANLVGLIPVHITWAAYRESLSDPLFVSAFGITFKRILLGVATNMVLTVLMAYPLSKEPKIFPYRNVYAWVIVFTMLFSGGLIPTYMLVNQLGLMNSIWALILPGAVPVFNVVLLMNFFRQLPKELEESAFIDGASHMSTLLRIFLPLSMPALATITLFCVVGHWNAWFDGLIYMNNSKLYPLQTYLQILLSRTQVTSMEDAQRLYESAQRSLYTAKIFLAILPILIVYPFLQKYFVKGIVLGSVKE